MGSLFEIAERIRGAWEEKNAARDRAILLSREIIRSCALSMRAVHRDAWQEAEAYLRNAQQQLRAMCETLSPYPDLLSSGYVQDAAKELTEASILLAVARDEPLPEPESLGVEFAAYLNGLAEAASELRRRVLDLMRQDMPAECERLLSFMDDVYDVLVTMDFPEAITGNLRKNTDLVRGVLERTRGDFTLFVRERRLRRALEEVAARLDADERASPT
ncbi:MAG: hypothetical protein NZL91_04120 [Thermoflexales bacterium]|nr:hypothetical protein [Thermoflexales bacterium]MCS7325405.1 hypothetical protein [Thermoflexales bacterium]MCX7938333.1 hypothetical protein [Thermoflexales bacterium]MDW8053027.1 haloacid dehalogenase [Anaerolineae bacterium]MDW8291680.1 haloacid dehalogenase [Anaerolineae bacterium]